MSLLFFFFFFAAKMEEIQAIVTGNIILGKTRDKQSIIKGKEILRIKYLCSLCIYVFIDFFLGGLIFF